MVYLPGQNQWVQYNNSIDVLALNFGAPSEVPKCSPNGTCLNHTPDHTKSLSGGISDVLEAIWCDELAETLHQAKRIALNVDEIRSPYAARNTTTEEMTYLACYLQKDLKVLYLIDYCVGRCKLCSKGVLEAADLQQTPALGGNNSAAMFGSHDTTSRSPDIIAGVGCF